ncbi:MAG TPA: iron-sulfur cluster assembly protein, partial [Devosia sp.]|nr:iron-sulfur cluster assembly protein [Devosia sp.]
MSDEATEKAADLTPAPAPAPTAELTEQNRIVPNMSATIPPEEVARITADLIGVLKTVYDPEIPVDIYELGLIYKVELDDDRHLTIDMTLT